MWDLSWGKTGSVTPEKHGVRIEGESENSVTFIEQSSQVDFENELSIITISALMKTKEVVGKGAGLNIGLYDADDQLIATKDMGGYYSLDWIRGNTDWSDHSISIVAPKETDKIKVGVILYGRGILHVKDYDVVLESLKGRKPSRLAERYITAVCDTISENSLVRDSVNITKLKTVALAIAGDAMDYADCFLSVNFLLESLRPFGDNHSFFMTAEEVANWENEGSEVSEIEPHGAHVIDSCGYLLIPAFHGGNQKQIETFARGVQRSIDSLYNLGIKGWIVDLRQNTGGNMEPMIAGLGPLFSDNKLGSLINVNGVPASWFYEDGRYYWDDDEGWNISNYTSLNRSLPIAVLTSNQTGSSGEVVVVSFIGNHKTKLFGQPTWGLTTGNGDFLLEDGSMIFLASTKYADRNGRVYSGSITPDYLLDDLDKDEKTDVVISRAIEWIFEQ